MSAERIPQSESADFGIVTALGIERRAVCKSLGLVDRDRIKLGNRVYWKTRFPLPGGEFYEVVVAQAADMANIDAALLTSDLIHDWKPSALLLAGIAGAASAEVALGDVVFGSSVYYHERGKVAQDSYKPEPVMFKADAKLWATAQTLPDWEETIPCARPDGHDLRPKVHYGVIACGETVIAEEKARNKIAEFHRKILAIEMEGYGFSAAAWQSFQQCRHLVVRAVSDKADRNKTEDWQPYASAVVAGIVRHFLLDRPLEARAKRAAPADQTPSSRPVRTDVPAQPQEPNLTTHGIHRWDILLSYSRHDLEIVRTIETELERRGLRVWRDEKQILAGVVFSKAIEEALQDTAAVGVIVSPDAISSKWVQEEYYRALSLANRPKDPVRLIPILVKDADLPGFLANRQWVDLRDAVTFSQNIEHIVRAVKGEANQTTRAPNAELLPFRFLWYFPEGLLRPIYDHLVASVSDQSSTQAGLTKTVEMNGIEIVKVEPERLMELNRLLSNEAVEGRQVFRLLQQCFAQEDPFAYSEELGVGRALLLRDLVHLAGFLRPENQEEAEGRSYTLELARAQLSKIIEERHTRIAFEVNQGVLELSFAPEVSDQLMRARLFMLIGEAERAADLFELYRGSDLFAGEELDELRRIEFALDWAKAAKDSGRARKMHAELMRAYDRMIDLVSHLTGLLPESGPLDDLHADILHNRATQAAVFGDDQEWSKAKEDFKIAAAKYRKGGNHEGFLTCQCALVAHSLDRLGEKAPLPELNKMLELGPAVRASVPSEALFFYYYQRARVLKRMYGAGSNAAVDAYLSAARVAEEAGLESRAAIAKSWVVQLQWQGHALPENGYLSGLKECIAVLRRFPQDAWSMHAAAVILVRMAEVHALRSENGEAWVATVEAFDMYWHLFGRDESASIRAKAIEQLQRLITLSSTDAMRMAFVHEFDFPLRSLLGLTRWESLTWQQLQTRMRNEEGR
jgi:nucleoside phosphorylase